MLPFIKYLAVGIV